MPRTARELLADGARNAAEYDKRLADERYTAASLEARFAERWEETIGQGYPFWDWRTRRMWVVRQQPESRAAGEDA